MKSIYNVSEHELLYIPNQLDVLWMISEPHIGREAGSHNPKDKRHSCRPYLVVSSRPFNNGGFVEAMSITSHNHFKSVISNKLIPLTMKTGHAHGYILPIQILGRDAIARQAKLMGHADPKLFNKIELFVHDIFAKQID